MLTTGERRAALNLTPWSLGNDLQESSWSWNTHIILASSVVRIGSLERVCAQGACCVDKHDTNIGTHVGTQHGSLPDPPPWVENTR